MTRETVTCATCRFWKLMGTGWGQCRKQPPAATSSFGSGWPQANADDWCGEHQPVAPAPAASDDYTRAAVRYAEAEMRWMSPNGMNSDVVRGEFDMARDAFLRLYREKRGA